MMSTPRIDLRNVTLGLALGLAACGSGETAGGGGFQRPPTPVEAAEVKRERITDRFEAVGSVQAAESITVVSEIPGVVKRLPFREGDAVSRGALLAQLDDAELAAAASRAEAIRDQRKVAFDRIELVVRQGAGTPQDLDDAAAELKIAEADVALARARSAKARITAPFAGRVGARQVSPGAFLQPGQAITRLSSIATIKVAFSAPERYVPQLTRGAEVQIATPAFPGVTLTGTIEVVDPVLDVETRSAQVIARAENLGERFRPGMSANVSAILSQRDQALTIPAEAIFSEGDQSLVFLIQPDSTVARTPVSLGLRLASTVEVVDGLAAGQHVVRAGHQKLFPGAKVMPVQSQPDAEGGSR